MARPEAQAAARVVFVNRFYDPDQSATSRLLTDLARHLAANGRRVTVVTGRQAYDRPDARLPAVEVLGGVRVVRVGATRFGRGRLALRLLDYASFYLMAALALLREVGAGDVVVAKTDPPLIALVALLAARQRGARLVNWVQDVFPEVAERAGLLPPLPGRALRAVRDATLAGAARTVALGQDMAAMLRAAGAPDESLAVIPNWADGELIRADAPGAAQRRQAVFGASDGDMVVLYSGNLGRVHEADTLIQAARVLADDARIRFVVAGGGALRPALAAANLANLRLLPYAEEADLPAHLAAADVHLVVLRPAFEGLVVPSKTAAALAAGRPVVFVGSPQGETARRIEAAGAGIAVGTGDGEALAAALRALATDADARIRMGHAARALFEARFSRDAALSAWSALLAEAKGGEE